LGGDAATNIFFTTHQGIYDKTPVSEAFNAAYEAEYGKPPEAVFAALGYDGIKLMAAAITRAGTVDGAAVRVLVLRIADRRHLGHAHQEQQALRDHLQEVPRGAPADAQHTAVAGGVPCLRLRPGRHVLRGAVLPFLR
jgi:hypothetical protein